MEVQKQGQAQLFTICTCNGLSFRRGLARCARVSCVMVCRQDAGVSPVPAVRAVRHTAVWNRRVLSSTVDTRFVTLVQFVERNHHDGRELLAGREESWHRVRGSDEGGRVNAPGVYSETGMGKVGLVPAGQLGAFQSGVRGNQSVNCQSRMSISITHDLTMYRHR